jgi:GNAT superfamily N-acetyltransferase
MATPLPILQIDSAPSDEVLVRFFHRGRLHWRRHLGQEMPCEVGTALVAADEPLFNTLMEAAIPADWDVEAAVRAVEAAFGAFGGCRTWIMNPSAPAEQTGPLVERLLAEGYHARAETIFHLPNPSVPAVPGAGGLKILPARAAYGAVSQLAEAAAAESRRAEWAKAALLHLDDGHYDALIALEGNRAIGRVGVLAVGEIGLIQELYVIPSHRNRNIESSLLARAVEIGARSRFRHLFAGGGPPELLKEAGFISVGRLVSYERMKT